MNRVLLLGALTGACLLAACGGGNDAATADAGTTANATSADASAPRTNAAAMAVAATPAADLPRAVAPTHGLSEDDTSASTSAGVALAAPAAAATTATTATALSATGSATTDVAGALSAADAAQLAAIEQVHQQLAGTNLPGTLALTWKPTSGAASYRVYFGTASRAYQQRLGAGVPSVGPALDLTGLVSGTTYYFSVTCVDATGKETGYSDEMTQVVS